ncbi:MAG: glycosyltransferase [Candidatus Eisenbacteria bacterium]|nr:glycosyltransferase [Candidatus Eisenbacteria bacterium]
MRIAYLSIGGHIHTIRWLRYFVEQGHEVHLMTVQPSPIDGVTVHDIRTGIPFKPLHYAVALGHVKQLMRRIRPDILHTHFLTGYGYWGAFSGFHPHVLTVWGDDVYVTPHETPLKGWLARRALRSADLVTGDSEDIIEHAVRMGARREACHVVQWGVDLDRFRPDAPTDVRDRLGIPSGAPVVISTRSFTQRYYNIELIVRTIPKVLDLHPETRFIIAGNEGDDTELQDLADELGVRQQTTFVGRIPHDELPAWLAASDIFLTVPSVDATAVSLLEAMAAGVPVVTSDLESAMEWVVDGESGLAVPPENAEALLAAIVRLIESSDLRVRLGARASETVRERADHRAHMARMELLMETLLNEWRKHGGR